MTTKGRERYLERERGQFVGSVQRDIFTGKLRWYCEELNRIAEAHKLTTHPVPESWGRSDDPDVIAVWMAILDPALQAFDSLCRGPDRDELGNILPGQKPRMFSQDFARTMHHMATVGLEARCSQIKGDGDAPPPGDTTPPREQWYEGIDR